MYTVHIGLMNLRAYLLQYTPNAKVKMKVYIIKKNMYISLLKTFLKWNFIRGGEHFYVLHEYYYCFYCKRELEHWAHAHSHTHSVCKQFQIFLINSNLSVVVSLVSVREYRLRERAKKTALSSIIKHFLWDSGHRATVLPLSLSVFHCCFCCWFCLKHQFTTTHR